MMKAGGSVRLLPRYSVHELAGLIQNQNATIVSLVPTMLVDLIDRYSTNDDLVRGMRQMRAIVLGGAPLEHGLKETVSKLKLPVLTTYGMTETASMVTLLAPGSPPGKSGTSNSVAM